MNTGSALLKALLNPVFYEKSKHYLDEGLFPRDIKGLYNSIVKSHQSNNVPLSLDELYALHLSYNPVLSEAQKHNIHILIENIRNDPDFQDTVNENLIHTLHREQKANEIAQLALSISEGKSSDFAKLEQLTKEIRANASPTKIDEFTYISTDISDILSAVQQDFKWKFNLPDLQERLGGIGPGVFGILGARPETGKTAFHVSLAFGPGGWLEQGAKVHLIANEEMAARVMLRGVSANTGMTRPEIDEDLQKAGELFSSIKSNVYVMDIVKMSMADLDRYCSEKDIDVLIIDQLDKIQVEGSFARDDQRLKHLYIEARELAKRYGIAVIGVSQVSADAEGKLYYGAECMDGSKTGKFAECDFMVLIGREASESDGLIDNGFRVLNIPKNKMTGDHRFVPCVLNKDLSRYVP